MSNTFNVYIKNYENMEISTEIEFSENIYKALNLMFQYVAMIDFKAFLKENVLHILTNDKEEFDYLYSLYSNIVSRNCELMKVIVIDKKCIQ